MSTMTKLVVGVARVFSSNEVNVFFEPYGKPAKNNPINMDDFLERSVIRELKLRKIRE